MRLKDLLTEDVDKETFVKLLKNKAEFDITNTGTKLKATTIAQYGTPEADKILGIQLPKVKTAAEVMGVEWKMLYAKQFVQHPGYMGGKKRPVWTYALTGNDRDGTEVTYWKYEGQVAGGGQSHVYVDKDTHSKTKLSWIIDPKNKVKAKNYPKKYLEGKKKRAAQMEKMRKRKLTDKDIRRLIVSSNIYQGFKADGVRLEHIFRWRLIFLVNPTSDNLYGRPLGTAYSFIPMSGGRIKVRYERLLGDHEIKQGYADSTATLNTLGIFDSMSDALRSVKKNHKLQS